MSASTIGSRERSVRWMPRELLLPTTDPKSLKQPSRDIYAFGCTVLEIYTGMDPFAHCVNDYQVVKKLLEGLLPGKPRDVLPDGLSSVIEACWRKDPDQRPSAGIVVPMLEQVLSDHKEPENLQNKASLHLNNSKDSLVQEKTHQMKPKKSGLRFWSRTGKEVDTEDLPRMIGYLTKVTAWLEDQWVLVQRVSQLSCVDDSHAKVAIHTLRKELK
ncbi:hypothetical protein C8J56DRAFT_397307 [Mycena floridula]|nr:hypothetical protein C8J56DRAFT_397307 [Mycena floridula]